MPELFIIAGPNSSPTPFETAQEFRKAGYRINLIFMGLSSAKHAEDRVAIRMDLGGHGVDPIDIAERYTQGLKNLQKHVSFFDRASVLTSEKNQRLKMPVVLVQIEKGKVVEKAAKLPGWVQRVIVNLEPKKEKTNRLQSRKRK